MTRKNKLKCSIIKLEWLVISNLWHAVIVISKKCGNLENVRKSLIYHRYQS